MGNYSYEQLLELVIQDIPLKHEEHPIGISFVGPPGVGKSTISKLISKRFDMFITANDKIRRILDSLNINAAENQPLVERLAYDRTRYMLENGTSMIIDANMLTAYKIAEDNFNNFGTNIYFIKLECSEKEILRRLDYREAHFGEDSNNYSRAVKEDYYKYLNRLNEHPFPLNKVFFVVDTEQELEKQIDALIDKLNLVKN